MVGSLAGCSARLAIGHAAAALPKSVMNSRRLMSAPGSEVRIVTARTDLARPTAHVRFLIDEYVRAMRDG